MTTAARVQVVENYEELSRTAVGEFVRRVGPLSRARRVSVVLSGGQTPRRMYALLSELGSGGGVDWTKVEFFWSDERPVPPSHPDSNYRLAWEALLAPLGIAASQIHRMQGEATNLDAAARDYEREIAQVLGVKPAQAPPRFDFVLLGLGADGHTASLFPHTRALHERRRWVVANPVPQLETTRLTLTYSVLNAARCVLFLVSGAEKAQAVARVFAPEGTVEETPARGVCPLEGELLWLLDAAAAREVGAPPSSIP
ncbi:MAG: 6-phosphogluconolactonase [Candidatus Binatia bacterium]|nr:MAG: 6-phosphogluconolactonase [Candidatus Binatia bacterium]